MASWNELFMDEKNIKRAPEVEVCGLSGSLEKLFAERPLRLWDLCCGAGRHTVELARMGHDVYASDNAPKAIELTQEWLAKMNLQAQVQLADMTVCPWPKVTFHGAISWDALYHNTLANIRRAVEGVYTQLVSGGLFMGTFMSTKADLYGEGEEIEPDTFICPQRWGEKEIPHHYFDEAGIRDLFKKWELISLAEQVITYLERGEDFLQNNPFPYTKWGVLARKGRA